MEVTRERAEIEHGEMATIPIRLMEDEEAHGKASFYLLTPKIEAATGGQADSPKIYAIKR